MGTRIAGWLCGIVLAAGAVPGAADETGDGGGAGYIANAEIEAALAPMAANPVGDAVLRMQSVGDEYNVGVSVVRRAKVDGRTPPDVIVHSEVTEVYHILEGEGWLVTGGRIVGEQPLPADHPAVRRIVGPSSIGTRIEGGVARHVGPGDVVIIPARTPHGFRELLTDHIAYLLVRLDPHRVLSVTGPPDGPKTGSM